MLIEMVQFLSKRISLEGTCVKVNCSLTPNIVIVDFCSGPGNIEHGIAAKLVFVGIYQFSSFFFCIFYFFK